MRGKMHSAFYRLLCVIKKLPDPPPHFLLYFIGLPLVMTDTTGVCQDAHTRKSVRIPLATFGRRLSSDGWEGENEQDYLSCSLIPQPAWPCRQPAVSPRRLHPWRKQHLIAPWAPVCYPQGSWCQKNLSPSSSKPLGPTEHGAKHLRLQKKRRSMTHFTSHCLWLGHPAFRAGMPQGQQWGRQQQGGVDGGATRLGNARQKVQLVSWLPQ